MLGTLISLLIGLLILGLIFWIVRYAVSAFGLPRIIEHIAAIIIVVVALIWLVGLLGGGLGRLDLPLR